MSGHPGRKMTGVAITIAVILVMTGVLAVEAVAGRDNAQVVACTAVCGQLEKAEGAYIATYGLPASDLRDLVASGIISELPQCPDGGSYAVELGAGGAVRIVCTMDGRVMHTGAWLSDAGRQAAGQLLSDSND